jgi:hypothetical protein
MASKYDVFWTRNLKQILVLIEEAYAVGRSGSLDVSDIKQYGKRDNWSGTVVVSRQGHEKAGMAHARSLGNVILNQGLLEGFGDAKFRLSISKYLRLKAKIETREGQSHDSR